jgi:hypothetical protein
MLDFKRCRDQVLELLYDWDVDVIEATDEELETLYEQISPLAEGGEDNLGGLCNSDLHAAQMLEVMIRWELRIRETGEELPGIPYDRDLSAEVARENRQKRRERGRANSN